MQEGLSRDTVLGVRWMDRPHRALMEELSRLDRASEQEITESYIALVIAVERKFRAEEESMKGLDLPSSGNHCEQHAMALRSLRAAVPCVMRGNVIAARKVIRLLLQWLVIHVFTMDRILADALLSRAARQPNLDRHGAERTPDLPGPVVTRLH